MHTSISSWYPVIFTLLFLFATAFDSAGQSSEENPSVRDPNAVLKADFPPLPEPGDDDWLANHREPGQTYENFLVTRRNKPGKSRRTLCLAPIDSFGDRSRIPLALLGEFAALYFCMKTIIDTNYSRDPLTIGSRINEYSLFCFAYRGRG